MPVTLTLAMIVKNEEETLERCLKSVCPFFDEIIIADTGSTDKTKSVAAHFTDKIFDFEWCDDFSAARNFAFGKATGDYIMWLDADDVIEGDNAQKFRDLKKTLQKNAPDVVMCRYNISFDENGTPKSRIKIVAEHVEFEDAVRRRHVPRAVHAVGCQPAGRTDAFKAVAAIDDCGEEAFVSEKYAAHGAPVAVGDGKTVFAAARRIHDAALGLAVAECTAQLLYCYLRPHGKAVGVCHITDGEEDGSLFVDVQIERFAVPVRRARSHPVAHDRSEAVFGHEHAHVLHLSRAVRHDKPAADLAHKGIPAGMGLIISFVK